MRTLISAFVFSAPKVLVAVHSEAIGAYLLPAHYYLELQATVDERPNLGYRSEKVKDFVSSDWIRTPTTR